MTKHKFLIRNSQTRYSQTFSPPPPRPKKIIVVRGSKVFSLLSWLRFGILTKRERKAFRLKRARESWPDEKFFLRIKLSVMRYLPHGMPVIKGRGRG